MFVNLPSFALLGILFASFFALSKAADMLVRALVNLGILFRVSIFALSFILLGLVTSLPEMLIGVYAVADGFPSLSLGNLIGGIIVLLTLVMGLNGLLAGGIPIDGKFARYTLCRFFPKIPWCPKLAIHDLAIIGILLIAPVLAILDGQLSRIDGVFLIALYSFYVWYYVHEPQNRQIAEPEAKEKPALIRSVGLFIAGAVILGAVARIVVMVSETLLVRLGVPSFLFGLLALSIGTNLPELTVMIRARRAKDISAGNILGSAVANILIIGLLGFFAPLSGLTRQDIFFSTVMLGAVVLLLIIFFRSKNQLSRYESLILILCYIFFVVVQSLTRF
ncbi:hypothetical protein A3B21_02615 [Candidatus Uhrbacteria bacterium RIFCSPLOWO2_01_FULL_47_24]|uniref:Sodium/calcium exchanger membrane region domain-containing protein n=1 Tax=Candidatus Uhrbacteria bacterium RIFCSPLOWO2_01_FULL_47_24 TaxID=1802401 RepID=A0A1F7UP33_9BACT|nr:MAG: hypothetical protein A2753_00585 [Candidatus Uhrbacteria bacterium RIFCSPHIGHO2_01_FULL_47_11]OGL68295.1 MAG: hypothetical protein A3D58_04835 [Candidatus Uhrbacteria bacterium RIFCSPHIGHO2_02_FULL_46_47]OGL75707.1 MAG: hypothetical protein A3F52_01845 [Candidatus Uhrbacteria bacterium RIFCSPHIGHO2_12_FULL_47_11]OGL80032.1 MAG: hypothetical protein A3B21_02615 [Candidatus Uhrbacteria bacterium RIFCSPLOWO2_01_FULL_47_24]OGL85230.1 MAG: hypothetical protein A3J03_00205 [Candidatus Uhrbact